MGFTEDKSPSISSPDLLFGDLELCSGEAHAVEAGCVFEESSVTASPHALDDGPHRG